MKPVTFSERKAHRASQGNSTSCRQYRNYCDVIEFVARCEMKRAMKGAI